jgi:hypothetical protein
MESSDSGSAMRCPGWRGFGFGVFLVELGLELEQVRLADQRLHGVGAHIVPVAVEAARQILDDGAAGQNIEIDKIAHIGGVKVGIAQVASANHGQGVVGHEQLVVHALLGALKVGQQRPGPADGGGARAGQRIEHAHLHIGHKSQAHDLRVGPRAVEVVQQHAYAHAAPGRLHDGAQQSPGALVCMDGVVLQIQRLLCVFHQRHAAAEGMPGAGDQGKSRGIWLCLGRASLRDEQAQLGALGLAQCGADGALHILG